jgi:hypothetical protein
MVGISSEKTTVTLNQFQGLCEMPKEACSEEMLNRVQHDTFRVWHDNFIFVIVAVFLFLCLHLFYQQDMSFAENKERYYQYDKNPFHPANKYDPDNPYSPYNRYNPDSPLNPANKYDPDNPLNPMNKYDTSNPFNPLNKYDPDNPLSPINKYDPDKPLRPIK